MKTKQIGTICQRPAITIPTLAIATLLTASAVARADTIYVSNYQGNYIERFTADGNGTFFGSTSGSNPAGLAFDGAGNLYAANYSYSTIDKFVPGGVRSLFANAGLSRPWGLTFDSAGN